MKLGTLVRTPRGIGRIAGTVLRSYIVNHHDHLQAPHIKFKSGYIKIRGDSIPLVYLYPKDDVGVI